VTSLFDFDGDNLDLGFVNIREGRFAAERRLQRALDAMWVVYAPYADSDFREGFARDPDARFWEMYLGCALIEAGKLLLPSVDRRRQGGQPDICVLEAGRRIWIEAIAPDRGTAGPDYVGGPRPINEGGGFEPAPLRQAQLRLTSAILTKSRALERYLGEGTIQPEDVRIIAIGGGRFGLHVPDNELPLVLSAVFPIGAEFVRIDRRTGQAVDHGFELSLTIQRQGGVIPRTAFLDERFCHISGAIWSRAGIGNMVRDERPLTFVHNPIAKVPMSASWGVWDREFVTEEREGQWEARDVIADAAPHREP
jgi:hypothetical protein